MIVIRGYLVSVSAAAVAAKRVAIGFGAGASELSVAVEGYQMTAAGAASVGHRGQGRPWSSQVDRVPRVPARCKVLCHWQSSWGSWWPRAIKGYGEISGSSTARGPDIEMIVTEIAKQIEQRYPGPRVDRRARVVEHKVVVVVPVAPHLG